MARKARKSTIDPNTVQCIHVSTRCVRQNYLLKQNGSNYRKSLAKRRLRFLASIFGIDVVTYCVMSNHIHQVLRSRKDVVDTWDDEAVAKKVAQLSAGMAEDGSLKPIKKQRYEEVKNNRQLIKKWRERLSDVSWWMRYFNQYIARMCNKQDGTKGHFWEARFYSQLLSDESSLLSCMMYVDLNPIRAGMAASPEEADFTGALDRLSSLRQREEILRDCSYKVDGLESMSLHAWERCEQNCCNWLSPIEIHEGHAGDPIGADADPKSTRSSLKGVLPFSIRKYLEFLDWTGRQKVAGKASIPAEFEPIVERLDVSVAGFIEASEQFKVA